MRRLRFMGATLAVALLIAGCGDDAPLGGPGATPPSPTSDGRFSVISSGVGHSCAITIDGAAACWGRNPWGQSDAPEGQFSAIAAGNISSCAITTGGTGTCWGEEGWGQLDAPDGVRCPGCWVLSDLVCVRCPTGRLQMQNDCNLGQVANKVGLKWLRPPSGDFTNSSDLGEWDASMRVLPKTDRLTTQLLAPPDRVCRGESVALCAGGRAPTAP